MVNKHRIYAFFPVVYDGSLKAFSSNAAFVKLESEISNARLSIDLSGSVEADGSVAPAADVGRVEWKWKAVADKGIAGDDFSAHIRQMLGSRQNPRLCLSFILDDAHQLSQFNGGKGRHWAISLGPGAQKRCGAERIMVRFEGARYFIFRTGMAVLQVAWSYAGKKLSPDILLEGNYSLSHHREHGVSPSVAQLIVQGGDQERSASDMLQHLVSRLVPEFGIENAGAHDETDRSGRRRILYSLVELSRLKGEAAPSEEASQTALVMLATRLSHRQTVSYTPELDLYLQERFMPFRYQCHAAAIEGGASVVLTNESSPEFLRNFVNMSGANVYIPLFISAMHSHFWLRKRSEWVPEREGRENGSKEVETLAELHEETLEFRRFFHPPLVSQISLHNAFHGIWQNALKIEHRLAALEQTTHKVSELIQTRRTRWIGRVSGAIGGFLVSRELLEAASANGVFFNTPTMIEWAAKAATYSPEAIEAMVHRINTWEVVIFLGSLVGALTGLFLAWAFDSRLKGE